MKYNLSVLKNKTVKFISYDDKYSYNYMGIVKNVKNNKKCTVIYFMDDKKIEINTEILNYLHIKKQNDLIICEYDPNNKIKSGLIGFTLYETYGFPIELTQEILLEQGIEIDMQDFLVLCQLQKEMSNNTFKNKNAF